MTFVRLAPILLIVGCAGVEPASGRTGARADDADESSIQDAGADVALGPPTPVVSPARVEIPLADLPFVVVYNEEPDAFCVEPQSAPPNSLNDQPHIVEPGRPLVANAHVAWRQAVPHR